MDAIKKFINKKKTDVKFVKAGEGKKLTEPSSSSSSSRSWHDVHPAQRVDPSASAQRAGEAALNRYSTNKNVTEVNWSMQAIKAQARREMEAEKRLQELSVQEVAVVSTPKNTAVQQRVMFSCPLLGPQVASYDTIKAGIRDLLYAQLGDDQAVAACLIIHTCNKSKEKIQVCIDTLCKYIVNIVEHPGEDKYYRIRHGNKAYQERVKPVEGATQFLQGAGFVEQQLPSGDNTEMFWVFPSSSPCSHLSSLCESLRCAEPIRPQLERSPVLLLPQEAARPPDLPDDFYAITKEELAREQAARREAVEQSMVLRTKAMRERANMREVRKYRFTLIRVRFPDGLTLQATFRTSELLEAVTTFIRGYLVNDWRPYCLCPSGGKKFTPSDESLSLASLYLVPAAVLNFQWDESVSDPNLDDNVLLGPEAYQLLKNRDLREDLDEEHLVQQES